MTPAAIKRIKDDWQPFYEEELTDDDAVEITNNLSGFFQILHEESQRQGRSRHE